jgi:immunoglobulin superfamily member 9B
MPGNVTVRWFREGAPVREVAALETRVTIRKDGTLIINPVSADDSGTYTCEVSNGIGDAQSAGAYLNVECELMFRKKLLIYISLPPAGLKKNKQSCG